MQNGKRKSSIANFLEKFRIRSESLPGWMNNGDGIGPALFSPLEKIEDEDKVPADLYASKIRTQKNQPSKSDQKTNTNLSVNFGIDSIETSTSSSNQSNDHDDQSLSTNESKRENCGSKVKKDYVLVPIEPLLKSRRSVSRKRANDALGIAISALYGKMLVVMGIAFPMSEVISTFIPPAFYDGFYLYLYLGSITYMIYIYGITVRQKTTNSVRSTISKLNSLKLKKEKKDDEDASNDVELASYSSKRKQFQTSDEESEELSSASTPFSSRRSSFDRNNDENEQFPDEASFKKNYGSFYLRIGAVAFGIGSMIYSGLEFGQYFELVEETKCRNVMIALKPGIRMVFTFAQMYFIFMNSKMKFNNGRLGGLFGLMHMIGTNLCLWLNVIVQETRHEILHFYNPDVQVSSSDSVASSATTTPPSLLGNNTEGVLDALLIPLVKHGRDKRGLRGPHSMYECRRTDIFGSLVQNSSPFLFPCTIEYSLICAAILYVMWKDIAKTRQTSNQASSNQHSTRNRSSRSPHHYSVDCSHAHKGLFIGIFALVMTVISLILFFVLMRKQEYKSMATVEVNITELVLYTISAFVVLIGICQVRELRFTDSRNLELDNILLIVAQTGSIIYNIFTIIAGYFTMFLKSNSIIMMVTSATSLVQLLLQTLFILDASKRCASNSDQIKRKPGREIVTFLLVTNLALWLINTLEKSRADSQTIQLKFYGVWAWTIINQCVMPLAIFYRFHSTVCLCDIWKKAFKLKRDVTD